MKITEQDIIRTARELRDEANAQQHVRPAFHRSATRWHIPAWIVAVPAAAIIGFVLGLWIKVPTQEGTRLTELTDTIYIQVPPKPLPHTDSMAVATSNAPTTSVARRQIRRQQASPARRGRSVADDHIRYDLLLKN